MLHAFDSYQEIKDFTAAGFSESQAEKVVHLVMKVQKQSIDHLATKDDIKILDAKIGNLDAKIDQVESSLNAKIESSANKTKYSILTWVIPFLSANTLALIGLYAQSFFK